MDARRRVVGIEYKVPGYIVTLMGLREAGLCLVNIRWLRPRKKKNFTKG